MKIKLLFLTLIAATIAPRALTSAPLGAKASDNPFNQYYLRIAADETSEAWVQQTSLVSSSFENQVRDFFGLGNSNLKSPVIFFNLNPASNIRTLNKVYFELKDGVTGKQILFIDYEQSRENYLNRTDDKPFEDYLVYENRNYVGTDTLHTLHHYENRYTNMLPFVMDTSISIEEYSYNNDSQNFYLSQERQEPYRIIGYESIWKDRVNYKLPALGEKSILSKYYNLIGQHPHSASLLDSSFYEYGNTSVNNGYTSFQGTTSSSLTSKWGNDDFTHYLILPLSTTTNVEVNYLAIEGYDADGNLISPEIQFETDSVGTYFEFEKLNNEWTTPNAAYFPGNNRYTVTNVLLSEYHNTSSTFNPVVFSLGNLVGNTEMIELDDLTRTEVLVPGQLVNLAYTFAGDANCVVVDVPNSVDVAKVKVYFMENETGVTTIDPFYIILLDENGNYGVAGKLPLDNDPTGNWFTRWLSNLGFNLDFGVTDLLTYALIAAGALLIVVILVKVGGAPKVKIYNHRD